MPTSFRCYQADTLKHLRRVHFVLVTSCFALLAAAGLALDYDLEEAIEELDQVERLEPWLEVFGPAAWKKFPESERLAQLLEQPGLCLDSGDRRLYSFSESARAELEYDIDALVYEEGSNRRFYRSSERAIESASLNLQMYQGSRSTLALFRSSWNGLRPTLKVTGLRLPSSTRAQVESLDMLPSEFSAALLESSQDCLDWGSLKHLQIDRAGKELRTLFELDAGGMGQIVVPLESVSLDLEPLLVLHLDEEVPDFPALATRRAFASEFPALYRAADGLESLTLDDLGGYLRGLRQKKGEQVSLFGAAVPLRLLSRWGLAILIAVQLYFLIHLRASCWPPGADFAWIGVYKDPLARAVFHFSLSLVPPLAAFVLLREGLEAQGLSQTWLTWQPLVWLQIGGTLFSASVGALTLGAAIDSRRSDAQEPRTGANP